MGTRQSAQWSMEMDRLVTGYMAEARKGEDVNFREAMIRNVSSLSYQESTIYRVSCQCNPRSSGFNAKTQHQNTKWFQVYSASLSRLAE